MRAENPLHKHLVELFGAAEAATSGRLTVDVVPWGQSGPSKVTLQKLLSGEVEFHPISGMPLSTIVPLAAMEGLPYAFESEEQACRVFDGPFGDMIRREVSKKGLTVFPHIWWQGFNQMSTSVGPMRDASDLDGFKIRIAQVPYKRDLFSSLGCDPQEIHYQAIYDKLKSGEATGEETPYLYIELDRFAEVQSHLSVTNHRFASFWLCANTEAWNRLPDDIRTTVADLAAKQVRLYRNDMLAANAAACERLKGRLAFNVADTRSFVERLKDNGFYPRWRKEFGEAAWSLLETQRGAAYP